MSDPTDEKTAEITTEQQRMVAQKAGRENWQYWGPYLAERQWGTVREDYSADGEAWDYFTHEMSRSRAYRWGEDGLAGFSDHKQRICLSLALWNERDAILKERIFGLTNGEGNHGEDVKELYYFLDATPSHSYQKMLYKYPHAAFPYEQLIEQNARVGKDDPEFELIDTGLFDEDRYFDITVEYAQVTPGEILMRITAINHGPDEAPLHLIPQVVARNTWSWNGGKKAHFAAKSKNHIEIKVSRLKMRHLYVRDEAELLFCDNESNARRLWGKKNTTGTFKDAFHDAIVGKDDSAVNPARTGSKVGVHVVRQIPAGGTSIVELRLARHELEKPFADFDELMTARQADADEYYAGLQKDISGEDKRLVQRQAFAGMIWSKQYYYYDIPQWIDGDKGQTAPPIERRKGRNWEWRHLNNADIISMPDTWEYPWYAAWDLAFHCLPLAQIDPEFAKKQLILLTRVWYMHPNGQLPAYEWEFGDVNPPVHAWATWRVYQIDREQNGGVGDREFLERVFHKLMLNFTWWVNRKDVAGHNIFQGGFLGLDNIGVFDRSKPLPTGGYINQSDGTSWMAMYSLNLMRIALELALENRVYEDIATKFFEHFLHIAEAMTNMGDENLGLWDEDDKFFYDELMLPDNRIIPLKVRSMVGLIPLFATEIIEPETLEKLPDFNRRLNWYLKYRPELYNLVTEWDIPGRGKRRIIGLLRDDRLKSVLKRMLDPSEFLSDYGIRALSKQHEKDPYIFDCDTHPITVDYQPAESSSNLFGGNSNWRGPIWFPLNFLIIESLHRYHDYYGDKLKVPCPSGTDNEASLDEVADELSARLCKIFLRDKHGKRPVYGQHPRIQNDPKFADNVLFYEYFHGDTGRGIGANHQTGWTGLVASLLQPRKEE